MPTEKIEQEIAGLRALLGRLAQVPGLASGPGREVVEGLERGLEKLRGLAGGRAGVEASAREDRRCEALLQDVLDSMPAAVYLKDAQGRCVLVNRAWEALADHAPAIEGRTAAEIFRDPVAARFAAEEREVLAENELRTSEETVRRGSRTRTFLTQSFPIRDPEGRPSRVCSISTGISDRVAAEESQAESEERYRLLFQNSLDAVLLTEPDGAVLDANPAACRIFGYSVEDLRAFGRAAVVDASDPRLAAALEERRRTGRFSGELRLRRRDGSLFPAELTSVVFRDRQGRERTCMVVRDLTERKRAEEARRESEEKYRRLVETAHDLIWSVDAQGRITFINEAAREVYGREPAEMIGRPYTDFIPPGQEEANRRALELALASGGRVKHFENWVQHRDGTPVLLSANAEFLSDEGRGVLGSMGTSRDITEERRQEEALRRSQEWFAAVFHASPIPMGYGRLESGELLAVNERYARFFGYEPDELVGKPASELWADPAARLEVVRRIRSEGRVRDLEAAFRHRDGGIRYGFLSMEVLPSSGEPLVLAAVVDITDRRRAEDALRLSEATFRGAFEHAAVGMAVIGTDGRFQRANRALQRMLGHHEAELRQRTFADVTHPEDRDTGRELFEDLRRGTQESGVLEKRYLRRDGTVVWARLATAVVRSASGEVVHLVSQIEDITAQRRAEEALRRSEALFRELWEHMGTGVAVYEPAPDGGDFVFLDLNRAGERTAKARREEVRGRRLLDCFPGARDLGLWNLLWEVQRTGVPGRLPATRYEDARHAYWTENYVYRLPSGEVVAMFEDVTVRREAEEALRHRAEEIRRLGARLREVETEERRRLAGELHDQVGQNLTALGISLRLLEAELGPGCAERVHRRLADCQALLDQIGSRVRDVMGELRPQALVDYGLRAELRGHCIRFAERNGIACTVEGEEFSPRLPPGLEATLFRVVQEALGNVAKHARAARVTVSLVEEAGTCRVSVADDGIGFALGNDESRSGWGLSLMAERAEAAGGNLRVESSPGAGTRVTVEVQR